MDILQFQKERESELADFKHQYDDLKVTYASILSDAIHESDSQKQSELVRRVLETNSSLAQLVRDFVGKQKQGTGYDQQSVTELTDELIKYQTEYNKIKEAKDKTTTLELVLHENKYKLNALRFQFNIFLGLFLIGILIVIYYIFKLSGSSFPTSIQAPVQNPLLPLS